MYYKKPRAAKGEHEVFVLCCRSTCCVLRLKDCAVEEDLFDDRSLVAVRYEGQ